MMRCSNFVILDVSFFFCFSRIWGCFLFRGVCLREVSAVIGVWRQNSGCSLVGPDCCCRWATFSLRRFGCSRNQMWAVTRNSEISLMWILSSWRCPPTLALAASCWNQSYRSYYAYFLYSTSISKPLWHHSSLTSIQVHNWPGCYQSWLSITCTTAYSSCSTSISKTPAQENSSAPCS